MRLLFICSANKLRSPTAEQVFSQYEGIEALSAGTNNDADTPLDEELIEWADIIFVMEKHHLNKIRRKFFSKLKDKRIVTLGIKDEYEFMADGLIRLLKAKLQNYLVQV